MKKIASIAIFVLIMSMVIPAYADVVSMTLEKSSYTTDEKLTFIGQQDGKDTVFVIIRGPDGNFRGMLADPNPDQGEFKVIPQGVDEFFDVKGVYNATAFTDDQKEEEGIIIQLDFDGKKVVAVADFELVLKPISDKTIEEEKTLTFTAEITDASLDGVKYSLEKNPPSGAIINEDTGKFIWTPTRSHGNQQGLIYNFDIVVKKASEEDRKSIRITVTEPAPIPEPSNEPAPIPEPSNEPKPEPEPKEEEPAELSIPAPFVDESKDPQSYVDRYLSEAGYKKWFDDNYPEYESIYQAVGLEKPKELLAFVDPNLDPQYYVDRYLNEPNYKKWFDTNFPDMTIYEAVGLDEPEVKEPEFGECGPGTALVDGKCQIIERENSEGGGCLIATAAYGSEMAPQVQFLREIRDGKVMSTSSGAAFMTGFNQFYYSFSPAIADYERENPVFKEMVKIGITPMLTSLSILSHVNIDSEQEMLGYGIGIILINVGMYFAAPAMAFFGFKKLRNNTRF